MCMKGGMSTATVSLSAIIQELFLLFLEQCCYCCFESRFILFIFVFLFVEAEILKKRAFFLVYPLRIFVW